MNYFFPVILPESSKNLSSSITLIFRCAPFSFLLSNLQRITYLSFSISSGNLYHIAYFTGFSKISKIIALNNAGKANRNIALVNPDESITIPNNIGLTDDVSVIIPIKIPKTAPFPKYLPKRGISRF